jgi:hypothetical protein
MCISVGWELVTEGNPFRDPYRELGEKMRSGQAPTLQ